MYFQGGFNSFVVCKKSMISESNDVVQEFKIKRFGDQLRNTKGDLFLCTIEFKANKGIPLMCHQMTMKSLTCFVYLVLAKDVISNLVTITT